MGSSQPLSGQSPVLLARINEKRAELENLKQLRDLSAGVAEQMQTLEEKLSMLSNGTEAVAAVLSNWHNVLRAINMASMKIPKPKNEGVSDKDSEAASKSDSGVLLPQTLVRIPAEEAARQTESQSGSGKVE